MTKEIEVMLHALLFSENEQCANTARRVLEDPSKLDFFKKVSGSFMTCVLSGDYDGAMERADSYNRKCLHGLTYLSEEEI